MKKRVKFKNVILNRLLLIIGILIFVVVIGIYSYNTFKRQNTVYEYELGNKTDITDYEDSLIISYDTYNELKTKYNLKELSKESFDTNSYLALYDEYDPCGEKSYKYYKDYNVNNKTININFDVYNQCGFCSKKIVLYIIKIDKLDGEYIINIDYNYKNRNKCDKYS